MATALSHITECPVCMLGYENPKLLPCDHSLCEKCVQRIKRGSRIKCPLCNATHEVSKLRTDFRLTQFLEALQEKETEKEISPKSESRKCELCRKQPISHHCEDCEEWMCTDCKTIHLRSKLSTDHNMKALSTKCQVVVDQFSQDSSKIKHKIEVHSRNIEKIDSEIRRLENTQTNLLEVSDKLRQKSIKEVNDRFDSIDAQIIEFIYRNLDKLQAQKGKLEKKFNDINSKYYILEKLVMESAAELAIEGTSTLKEIQELGGTSAIENVEITEAEIKLVQTKAWDASTAAILELNEDRVTLGEGGKPDLSVVSQTHFLKQKEVSFKGYPCLLRLIKNQLWLCQEGGGIEIFDDELRLQDTIKGKWGNIRDVTEMQNGDLVVACENGLIHLMGGGEEIRKIAPESYCCVVKFDNKIYAYNDKRNLSAVKIYSFDGRKFTWIKSRLSPCNDFYYATLHVTDNTINVCCCTNHQIISILETGQIIHKFGESGSDSAGKLSSPFICQGDSGGALLIADRENNRLQTVDKRGEWKIVRLEPDVIKPRAAVYNDGKLYIVSEADKTISIYSFN